MQTISQRFFKTYLEKTLCDGKSDFTTIHTYWIRNGPREQEKEKISLYSNFSRSFFSFLIFWFLVCLQGFLSIRIRHFTSTSLLPQSLWKTTLDHTSVSNTPVLPGVYVLFLGPFRKEPQITKLFRANDLYSLVKWPSTQKERISTKVGGEGGTASDYLPLTSDHQWVRRSVKYHSESNIVWLIEKGMYLIIHNKLWIFVEDRILSFSQWHEWFQHPLRVCFCWSAILQSVSFTYNCTNVDCIPVMKEVLVRRKKFYIRYPSAQEYLWNITIFTLWELFFWYLSNILESLFTMSRFCSW